MKTAMKHTYALTGLSCSSCVQKVTAALQAAEGVLGVEVTRNPMRATVTVQHPIPHATLAAAVAAAGDYRLLEAGPEPESSNPPPATEAATESLYPLMLLVGYLLGTAAIIELLHNAPSWSRGMRHFMAGFFLVFSFFKLLDLPGFVAAYRGYDLLARRSPAWAWAYPFVELTLGVVYLLHVQPRITNGITLVLMLVGAAGVLQALRQRRAVRCACLGTALNLPMTKVTLVEDLSMAVMAATMLVLN